jgi:hypothetical protein
MFGAEEKLRHPICLLLLCFFTSSSLTHQTALDSSFLLRSSFCDIPKMVPFTTAFLFPLLALPLNVLALEGPEPNCYILLLQATQPILRVLWYLSSVRTCPPEVGVPW